MKRMLRRDESLIFSIKGFELRNLTQDHQMKILLMVE